MASSHVFYNFRFALDDYMFAYILKWVKHNEKVSTSTHSLIKRFCRSNRVIEMQSSSPQEEYVGSLAGDPDTDPFMEAGPC